MNGKSAANFAYLYPFTKGLKVDVVEITIQYSAVQSTVTAACKLRFLHTT